MTDASLFVNNVIVGVGYASEMGVYPKGLQSGSIRYAYQTNTLTLDGIDMKCNGYFVLNKQLNNLKIAVKGTNTVNANKTWCIFSLKDFSVEGSTSNHSDSKLTINNSFGSLCYVTNGSGTMTLKDLTLDVEGSDAGIYSIAS